MTHPDDDPLTELLRGARFEPLDLGELARSLEANCCAGCGYELGDDPTPYHEHDFSADTRPDIGRYHDRCCPCNVWPTGGYPKKVDWVAKLEPSRVKFDDEFWAPSADRHDRLPMIAVIAATLAAACLWAWLRTR